MYPKRKNFGHITKEAGTCTSLKMNSTCSSHAIYNFYSCRSALWSQPSNTLRLILGARPKEYAFSLTEQRYAPQYNWVGGIHIGLKGALNRHQRLRWAENHINSAAVPGNN